MAEKSEKPVEETPVFDFGKVSQKDGQKISRFMMLMQHLGKRIDAATPDVDITPMLDELEQMQADAMGRLLACIVSLPKDWLINNAPAVVNYSNYDEAISYIRLDKFDKIGAAYQEAKSGN